MSWASRRLPATLRSERRTSARPTRPSGSGRLPAGSTTPGSRSEGRAHELREDDLDLTLAVNLKGVARLPPPRALARPTPGAIVNVSSVQAVAAFPAAFAYQASKGGVDALTRQVAVEYGPAGIRCNRGAPRCDRHADVAALGRPAGRSGG